MHQLRSIIERHKSGERIGITSICSAHPRVIEAALRHASAHGHPVLIEATSNQVDQFGGYTGMTPKDFRAFVHGIAGQAGLPIEAVILGGDHLGPNRWQDADATLTNAEALIEAYV